MPLMSCFFGVGFFFIDLLFFRDAVLGFAFPLLIPGIFDMSWARTGTMTTIRTAANNNAHTVMLDLILNVLGVCRLNGY